MACQWLLGGRKAPAHDTFQRFRRHHLSDGVMEDLFSQFNEILFNFDEIQFENRLFTKVKGKKKKEKRKKKKEKRKKKKEKRKKKKESY